MVTCPIDLYATATVVLSDGTGLVRGPRDCPKAVRAVALTLERFGVDALDAALSLESPIPRGKGMASSTADVVASVAATAAALGRPPDAELEADIALLVEPSDGTMLPGVALFDHVSGRVRRRLGDPPPIDVLVLEFEAELDTVAFNAIDRTAALRSRADSFRESLSLIEAGISTADSELIGRGASLSASTYQDVLAKPELPQVFALAEASGAVGVNIAHSGTVVGMLFNEDAERLEWAAAQARSRLLGLRATHRHRLIGGGSEARCRLLPDEVRC
ncbi:MAG: GHMP kinase [Chloroflexi bacterium]|nr:GHMP kinase [Chloroflexota bacterium]MCY3696680.1 GHMP kinase [Chloroflexota bacterium]